MNIKPEMTQPGHFGHQSIVKRSQQWLLQLLPLLLCLMQVIEHYREKVVKLEAAKQPTAVSAQIREALAKIKHGDE
jgi:hypothetical protein